MKSEIPTYDIQSIGGFQYDDIYVGRFGPYSGTHQHLHYPHRHSFYHVVLFTEGAGSHAIDFEKFEVQPWQIYFMIPGQVHSWSFDGDVDGYVLNFSSSYFQSFLLQSDYIQRFSFFQGITQDSVIQIPTDNRAKIKDIFERVLAAGGYNNLHREDYIKVLLLELFILVSHTAIHRTEKDISSYNYLLLKNFQRLIEANFKMIRLPKDYAQLLYITPNHLNALCNDLLGMPAGEVIRNRVLLEAKRLLVNLDLSINQISLQLNFSDNSYFTKFFKKYVSMTPDEFRKKTFRK
ncbi:MULTISPECIES: helix-turn-helix domain-containing protein [Sphingobacterium]|uniref:Helix-turn-helix domain-containing protein n=1 Tax=Sphingobacterium populi TaxID=1812824 RepID=A0ABW5UF84_9SPHI|nr:helix-turn-helix transcriptional regulator [Sphingobacterium sp. CFCC 11742]